MHVEILYQTEKLLEEEKRLPWPSIAIGFSDWGRDLKFKNCHQGKVNKGVKEYPALRLTDRFLVTFHA